VTEKRRLRDYVERGAQWLRQAGVQVGERVPALAQALGVQVGRDRDARARRDAAVRAQREVALERQRSLERDRAQERERQRDQAKDRDGPSR
jgi:hypothetical protein